MTFPYLLQIGCFTPRNRAAGRLRDHVPLQHPGLPVDRRCPLAPRVRGTIDTDPRTRATRGGSTAATGGAAPSRSRGDATALRQPRGSGAGARTEKAGVARRAAAARGRTRCRSRFAGGLTSDRCGSVRCEGTGSIARRPAGSCGTDQSHASSAGSRPPRSASETGARHLGSEAHVISRRPADSARELSGNVRSRRRAGRIGPASRGAAPAPAGGAGRC